MRSPRRCAGQRYNPPLVRLALGEHDGSQSVALAIREVGPEVVMERLPADIQTIVDRHAGRAERRTLGGNPPIAPHVWGWVLMLGYTSPEERKGLRAAGFRFSGGRWHRADG